MSKVTRIITASSSYTLISSFIIQICFRAGPVHTRRKGTCSRGKNERKIRARRSKENICRITKIVLPTALKPLAKKERRILANSNPWKMKRKNCTERACMMILSVHHEMPRFVPAAKLLDVKKSISAATFRKFLTMSENAKNSSKS